MFYSINYMYYSSKRINCIMVKEKFLYTLIGSVKEILND